MPQPQYSVEFLSPGSISVVCLSLFDFLSLCLSLSLSPQGYQSQGSGHGGSILTVEDDVKQALGGLSSMSAGRTDKVQCSAVWRWRCTGGGVEVEVHRGEVREYVCVKRVGCMCDDAEDGDDDNNDNDNSIFFLTHMLCMICCCCCC